jgi:hypothetical protein
MGITGEKSVIEQSYTYNAIASTRILIEGAIHWYCSVPTNSGTFVAKIRYAKWKVKSRISDVIACVYTIPIFRKPNLLKSLGALGVLLKAWVQNKINLCGR